MWHTGTLVAACGLLVAACTRDLVPRPGIDPGPHALGVWSLTHWTTYFINFCSSLYFSILLHSLGLFCYSFFNFLSWLLNPLLFKLSSFPIYAFKATKFSPHTGLTASHQFLQVIFYYLVLKYFIIYIVISFLTHGLFISIYPYFQKSWVLENCIMIRGHTLYYFCPLKFIENCSISQHIFNVCRCSMYA